jgi:hypothetical protein
MQEIDTAVAQHHPSMPITLRQVFYILEGRGVVKKTEKAFDRVERTVDEMLYTGVLDWDAIIDPGRVTEKHIEFADVRDALTRLANDYRTDWWDEQSQGVEIWSEKDTIAELLRPIADKWHVRTLVNRGYVSDTAMKDAVDRMNDLEKPTFILYVGDHNPSGMHMMDTILEKLETFGAQAFDLVHIALTQKQIEQYSLRPSRVKMSADPRAKKYVAKHDRGCWEVDALDPGVLVRSVSEAITGYIDNPDAFKRHQEIDRQNAERLSNIAPKL